MFKEIKPALFSFLFATIALSLVAYFHSNNIVLFDPKGIVALKERNLIITSVLLMLTIVAPIVGLMYFFAIRYRAGIGGRQDGAQESSGKTHGVAGELIWWVFPTAVVAVLAILTWRSAHELDPYKGIFAEEGRTPLTLEVVALNWKWLFIYPKQNIASVNFVEFPVGTPLDFRLTSDAPMNSFWIPQLGGQMYAMAGMVTQLHLIANEEGEYEGSAAEINGKGFSGMRFVAKAVSQADFDAWVSSAKATNSPLGPDEYNKLAQPSENTPKRLYSSVEGDLYSSVIGKFMAPGMTSQHSTAGGMY